MLFLNNKRPRSTVSNKRLTRMQKRGFLINTRLFSEFIPKSTVCNKLNVIISSFNASYTTVNSKSWEWISYWTDKPSNLHSCVPLVLNSYPSILNSPSRGNCRSFCSSNNLLSNRTIPISITIKNHTVRFRQLAFQF